MLTCCQSLQCLRNSIIISSGRQWFYKRPVSKSSKVTVSLAQSVPKKQGKTETQEDVSVVPAGVPFSHAKLGPFFQTKPELGNQFTDDPVLRRYLARFVPEKFFSDMTSDLHRFGDRVAGDIYDLSLEMEALPPRLEQIDAWGQRVDNLVTCSAWQKMKEIASQEGMIASGYERLFGEWSRLYQFSKFFLYEPSAGLYGCPLAMSNGAAKILELMQDEWPNLYQKAFHRLVARDPSQYWTSGQWMTEKQGGSDVALGTETRAYEQPDGSYKLYGYKWFSSATDADMTLTLARVVDKNGKMVEGTQGLSLFYLEVKAEDGRMNGIQMLKLKNKLGTRQLPTAELLIDGARALKISEEGRGVASISQMLSLTRIHTALHASSAMRRIINLARDYCTKRRAFGKHLYQHAVHVKTLASMEIEARAATLFCLEVSRLFGRQEMMSDCHQTASEKELLRLVVPLLKLYTAKQSVMVASEGLECFGGQGYIEDTDIPRILRDTQVTAIWEGTTNILSLDVLRAIHKSSGTILGHFKKAVESNIFLSREQKDLQSSAEKVQKSLACVLNTASTLLPEDMTMACRDFAYSLARIYMASLLLSHAADSSSSHADVYAAQRWCEKDLQLLTTNDRFHHFTQDSKSNDLDLIFEGHASSSI